MQQRALRVLVTGSNKGIGYGIIEMGVADRENLRKNFRFTMTARDMDKGEQAIRSLKKKYGDDIPVDLVKLDVSDPALIKEALPAIKKLGKIDVLVNNAGVYRRESPPTAESVENTMDTNYYGPRRLTEELLDLGLINRNGKILFISSLLGKFNSLRISNPEVYNELKHYQKQSFHISDLDRIVEQYRLESQDPGLLKRWQHNPYDTSKNFLSIYAYLLGWRPRVLDADIQVYSLDPGFCDTDLTKGIGAGLTYLQGAETPLFLMGLPWTVDRKTQGGYFIDKKLGSL